MSGFILFSKDERDLILFESKASVEGYIEAPEILEGIYELFDEKGNLYELFVNDKYRPQVGAQKASDPALLASYLKAYLAIICPDIRDTLTLLPLASLVETFANWQIKTGRP